MRKFVFICLIFALVSCSGMLPRREFIDHTFFASNPKIAVRISDEFVYDEKDQDNRFDFFRSGGESGTNINEEKFHFLDLKNQKAITIVIAKLSRGYWNPNLTGGIEHPLELGVTLLNGQKFQSAVFASQGDNGDCALVKYFGKITGPQDQTLIKYVYVQGIPMRLGDSARWTSPDKLNSAQMSFLQKFNDGCDEDIQFVEYQQPSK